MTSIAANVIVYRSPANIIRIDVDYPATRSSGRWTIVHVVDFQQETHCRSQWNLARCLPVSTFCCHPSLYSYSAMSKWNGSGTSRADKGWCTDAQSMLSLCRSSLQSVFIRGLHALVACHGHAERRLQSLCAQCYIAIESGRSESTQHTSIHSASMSPSRRIHWCAFVLLLDISLKVVLINPSCHSRVAVDGWCT